EAIANGQYVVIVEGEKCADDLWAIGIPATTNPGGAPKPGQKPKWRPEYSEALRGADLVVMPHDDPQGYSHKEAIVRMSADLAKRIRVLELALHWPEVRDKPDGGGDVSDGLQHGRTREEIDALIEETPDAEVSSIKEP